MENRDVARVLRETAQLLEIDGAPIGRHRSYEKAAELIESLPEPIRAIAADPERLKSYPGIGDRLAEHIREILATGDYSLRKQLLKKYPPSLLDLLKLQSLGPKKVAIIWKEFGAATVDAVEALAREGKLRNLPGFGEKSEQNILKAVAVFKKSAGRFHIHVAEAAADQLCAHILAYGKPVEAVTPAGSLRRGKETIGDLDLLVTLAPGRHSEKTLEAIKDHVLKFPGIEQTLARGENKVSFVLSSGIQVDVRILEKENFGAALMYFTGSKEHNVALRGLANKLGFTLNEYALSTLKSEKRVAGATETEIYSKLGLAFIEPELRENTGEIEAAASGKLPRLLELSDIRGDLQMHTTASDGKNSIEEMAAAARELGYEYIALTDHSKAVTVANGMDEKRTLEQIKKIRAANERLRGIRLLAGIEVDILKDGRLDLADDVLAQLDVVVASVHSYMNLDREAMTDRLLAAIENPYTQIIAHPTGRLLLRRDAFAYDLERILDACARHGVAVECNAYPDRLDLKDTYLRMARDRGVKVVISTDAHTTANLKYMKYGVQMARRGWLEKKDVLNTLPLGSLLDALRPKPGVHRPAAAPSRAGKKPSAATGRRPRA
jgi:DNA polymerase (family 10)